MPFTIAIKQEQRGHFNLNQWCKLFQ